MKNNFSQEDYVKFTPSDPYSLRSQLFKKRNSLIYDNVKEYVESLLKCYNISNYEFGKYLNYKYKIHNYDVLFVKSPKNRTYIAWFDEDIDNIDMALNLLIIDNNNKYFDKHIQYKGKKDSYWNSIIKRISKDYTKGE